jgi:hypothetical protein
MASCKVNVVHTKYLVGIKVKAHLRPRVSHTARCARRWMDGQ